MEHWKESRLEFTFQPLFSVTQDLSLYVEFTIRETFLYFGWVNGMKTEEIEEKLDFLLKFLQLPPANRFVKTLRLEQIVECQQ
jgi:ABC-type multidrug transport system ATPase subunit